MAVNPPPSVNPHRRALLRQDRSRQTREALIHAALHLWRERGFDETTVDDVSSAAGVARSTFYFHFTDRDALLREVAVMSTDVIGTAVAKATQRNPTLDAALQSFCSEVARNVERLPKDIVARVTLSVLGDLGHLGEDGVDTGSFARQLEDIFDQFSDEIRPNVDRAELAAVIAGMTMEGILRWSFGVTKSSRLRTVLRQRIDFVIDGVRSPHTR
jgi:AcrR family transcriptional regulator